MKEILVTLLILVVIAIGLLMFKIHQYSRPRIIRWQIGHQIFTFRFPFKWMHLNLAHNLMTTFTIIGSVILGILILMAILVFLFLFVGILLPVILIIGLIVAILVLIFMI